MRVTCGRDHRLAQVNISLSELFGDEAPVIRGNSYKACLRAYSCLSVCLSVCVEVQPTVQGKRVTS